MSCAVMAWSAQLLAGAPPNAFTKAAALAVAALIQLLVGTKNCVVAVLRTRRGSNDPKKKILSFLIGPPKEPPNWLRTNPAFLMPRALSSKVAVDRAAPR